MDDLPGFAGCGTLFASPPRHPPIEWEKPLEVRIHIRIETLCHLEVVARMNLQVNSLWGPRKFASTRRLAIPTKTWVLLALSQTHREVR